MSKIGELQTNTKRNGADNVMSYLGVSQWSDSPAVEFNYYYVI